jgi:hypothetical protein
VHYEVRDITNPESESRFEIERDEQPSEGEALALGSMVYEVVRVRRAVIEVTRQVGPAQKRLP